MNTKSRIRIRIIFWIRKIRYPNSDPDGSGPATLTSAYHAIFKNGGGGSQPALPLPPKKSWIRPS